MIFRWSGQNKISEVFQVFVFETWPFFEMWALLESFKNDFPMVRAKKHLRSVSSLFFCFFCLRFWALRKSLIFGPPPGVPNCGAMDWAREARGPGPPGQGARAPGPSAPPGPSPSRNFIYFHVFVYHCSTFFFNDIFDLLSCFNLFIENKCMTIVDEH